MDKTEHELIFKAYQRGLLRTLKNIKAALEIKDYSKAEMLIEQLIKDTEKDT